MVNGGYDNTTILPGFLTIVRRGAAMMVLSLKFVYSTQRKGNAPQQENNMRQCDLPTRENTLPRNVSTVGRRGRKAGIMMRQEHLTVASPSSSISRHGN